MEAMELDKEWLEVRKMIRQSFNRRSLPDLNAVLFTIGIQELGQLRTDFSKEEKQDLMHIAVCRLLSGEGYYRFLHRDEEGWPHYEMINPIPEKSLKEQEEYLKICIINYFKEKQQHRYEKKL